MKVYTVSFLLSNLVIFNSALLFGQDNSLEVHLNQKSSFRASESHNINYSNGGLNYSISFMSFGDEEYSFPLSLSFIGRNSDEYNRAGVVGQGWKLDYAPSITRSVLGYPDFDNENGTNVLGYLLHDFEGGDLATDNWELILAGGGNRDYQPDIFHYNGLHESTFFTIKRGEDLESEDFHSKVGNTVQYPFTNNSIDVVPLNQANSNISGNVGFSVRSVNGITFDFEPIAETNKRNSGSRCMNNPNAQLCQTNFKSKWEPNSIYNARNEEIIHYNYRSGSISYPSHDDYYSSLNDVEYDFTHNNYSPPLTDNDAMYYVDGLAGNQDIGASYQVEKKLIETIEHAQGTLIFHYDTYFTDTLDQPLLNEIAVYDNYDQLIGKISFTYTPMEWVYDQGSLYMNKLWSTLTMDSWWHRRLKRVEVTNAFSQVVDSYTFTYEREDNMQEGEEWYPINHLQGGFPAIDMDEYLLVEEAYMFRALTKVDLHSGASKEFTYELNDYSFQEYVQTNELLIAKGLRIKKIKENNGNGNSLITTYDYSIFDDETRSSGNLFVKPDKVEYIYEQLLNHSIAHDLQMNYRKSISGQGFASLGPVIYSNVTVSTETLDEFGNEVSGIPNMGYEEITLSNIGSFDYSFEYPGTGKAPILIEYWEVGKILNHNLFDGAGKLVRSTNYVYDYLKDGGTEQIFGDHGGTSVYVEGLYFEDIEVLTDYGIEHYYYYSTFPYLRSVQEIFYDDSEEEISSKITEYEYDYDKTVKLRSVATSNPDGSELKQLYKYSGDYEISEFPCLDEQSTSIHTFQSQKLLNVNIEKQESIRENDVIKNLSCSVNFFKLFDHEQEIPIFTHKLNTTYGTDPLIYLESNIESTSDGSEFIFDIASFGEIENEVILVNPSYEPIEWEDRHLRKRSILYDEERKLIYADVRNGALEKIRYTSFETGHLNIGGFDIEEDNIYVHHEFFPIYGSPSYAATGDFFYHLTGTTSEHLENSVLAVGDIEMLPSGEYLLTYWKSGEVVLNTDGSLNSSTEEDIGEWVYVEQPISCTGECDISFSTLFGSHGFIDEIRITPVGSTISTYGYNEYGSKIFESNFSGKTKSFEFDSKFRLKWVYNTLNEVIEKHSYQEKDPLDFTSYNMHTSLVADIEGLHKSDFNSPESLISTGKIKKSTSYTDGWGRHQQTQSLRVHTPMDIVSFNTYDPLGRELRKHIPYATDLADTETFIDDPESEQLAYYSNREDPNENTTVPFTETEIESSPLQRTLRKSSIGVDFALGSAHETEIEYQFNTLADGIIKWTFNHGGSWAYGGSGSPDVYNEGDLKKMLITDPNGTKSVKFTDARGREVAKGRYVEVFTDANNNDVTGSIDKANTFTKLVLTYYIYDDWNRLRFIVPQKAIDKIESMSTPQYFVSDYDYDHPNHHHEFVTGYRYDAKGRLEREKRPGEDDSRRFYYDGKDRLVLVHKPIHDHDEYTFFKYDSRDRMVLTGDTYVTSPVSIQDYLDGLTIHDVQRVSVNSSGSVFGYVINVWPYVAEDDVLKVFYFDTYDFDVNPDYDFSSFGEVTTNSLLTRGLATGSLTRILDNGEFPAEMLMTVSYYDEDRRMLQSITENHIGGYDRISNVYNDRGQLDESYHTHLYEDSSTPIEMKFDYDYYSTSGKLRSIRHYINDDQPVWISYRTYDELGKLKDLKLHKRQASNYLQNVDYRYNAQGQLTHINNSSLIIDAFNDDDDDVFGQELMYHKPSSEVQFPGSVMNFCEQAPQFTPRYDGNISATIWNAKSPDQDGATLNRHLYSYKYDDLGQLTSSEYGMDKPSDPGQFYTNYGRYNTGYNYDLGGNITRLQRRNKNSCTPNRHPLEGGPDMIREDDLMDDLTYSYINNGYKLHRVDEGTHGLNTFDPMYSHFTEVAGDFQTAIQEDGEYTYDSGGRNDYDKNKGIRMTYNAIDRIGVVEHDHSTINVSFTYDAAGNKLQKKVGPEFCSPNCDELDYIGPFVYENGELKMIYHPEGVIRPRAEDSDNPNEFVYDYFVKDYLGNVRAIVTEENEEETIVKFLATMEDVHANLEEQNFDNIDGSREDLPENYPVDGSVELNQRIAYLIADGEMKIGPSLVLNVKQGDKVDASVKYFYEEDAPGATYDNLGFFVDEILVALASSAAGVIPVGDGVLNNIASGNTPLSNQIYQLLALNIDTTDVSKPHGYLVYMAFDNQNQIVGGNSGAIQVTDPNQLRTILTNQITVQKDGYMHIYVSNGSSAKGISFDKFMVVTSRGATRQINHYYPYGLPMAGINGNDNDWLNKYTTKEHQTDEYADFGIERRGLEVFDFHARFWEPQLARWTAPDPAMQFSNPYLGIGNNPVMYVDPDGEAVGIFLAGVAIGGIIGSIRANNTGGDPIDGMFRGMLIGGITAPLGGIGGGGMPFVDDILLASLQGGAVGGLTSYLNNGNIKKGILNGAGIGALTATLMSPQLKNFVKGKGFLTNQKVFDNFKSGKYEISADSWQQEAVDYFGFDGKYDPQHFVDQNLSPDKAGDFAWWPDGTSSIHLNDAAFESYDLARAVSTKESYYIGMTFEESELINYKQLEYDGFMHAMEDVGLYPGAYRELSFGLHLYGKRMFPSNIKTIVDSYSIGDMVFDVYDYSWLFERTDQYINNSWNYTLPRRF